MRGVQRAVSARRVFRVRSKDRAEPEFAVGGGGSVPIARGVRIGTRAGVSARSGLGRASDWSLTDEGSDAKRRGNFEASREAGEFFGMATIESAVSDSRRGDGARRGARDWWIVGLLCAAGFGTLGWRIGVEPHFVDESAYISQAYYWRLLREGDRDSWLWLRYEALDLPPLVKYRFGAALEATGRPFPTPGDSARWYLNTSSRWEDDATLRLCRWFSAFDGALALAATYGLARMATGRLGGLAAGLLLVANPLFLRSGSRAMTDLAAESLTLASVLAGMWGWRRLTEVGGSRGLAGWLGWIAAGVLAGLATLAKLNGLMALLVFGAWAGLSALGGWKRFARTSAGAVLAGLSALWVFAALNPFVTARPTPPHPGGPSLTAEPDEGVFARLGRVLERRLSMGRDAAEQFPHNATRTLGERALSVAVQGFGRFGPLGPGRDDSTVWLDVRQDWGALAWLPLACAGWWRLWRLGVARWRGEGSLTTLGLLAQVGVSLAVVTAFLPLAWDRYYLPLQAPAAIGAGAALEGARDWLRSRRAGVAREGGGG